MKETIFTKEEFKKWWKLEGKIECAGAPFIAMLFYFYSGQSLVIGILVCFIAIYGYIKMYFKRGKRGILFLLSSFLLYKGIMELISYYSTVNSAIVF